MTSSFSMGVRAMSRGGWIRIVSQSKSIRSERMKGGANTFAHSPSRPPCYQIL
jgi:hypothetical protein